MAEPRHTDCVVGGIGVGEPCVHCGLSFGGCWRIDGAYCCAACFSIGWSRAHVVEHEVPEVTFTGTDVHRALQAWQRLSDNQRDTWAAAARLHVARGEKTTAAAEFVAARLKRRIREGRK